MSYKNLEKNREYTNNYRKTHPRNYKKEYSKEYKKAHPTTRKQNQEYRAKLKMEVFNAYGGAVCSCCGETHIEFLSIDHANNDGAEHRKIVPASKLYNWLKTNNFPSGYKVLCMNCNFAKGHFGICPHEIKM